MFPKYQYSEFLHNGHDGQFVVRTNDKEEFELMVTYIQSKVDKALEKHDPIQAVTKDVNTHPCKTCGAMTEYKSGTSKAGKPWAGHFCQADKTHVEWVHLSTPVQR